MWRMPVFICHICGEQKIFLDIAAIERFVDFSKVNLVIFDKGVLVLGSSHLPLLPQPPDKMIINSKVVKSDSKIFKQSPNFLSLNYKSVTYSILKFHLYGEFVGRTEF